ncbi:hypothetical protein FNH09_40525 [Streptomyces adustus]|uniref:Uncharacterized protein n=1 Tax=Streptomyces adustus TaxID=1609272 RepID=A0A5N8VR54_9ACTN|nr:hypothetical protein [Streptomyces adustus]MPY37272.1 hypothetical protein [Streptomyces adustus]
MAATSEDPHSLGELARVVVLGARIVRRQERGKPTARLEARVDRIRAQAEAREAARAKARKKK